MYPVIRYRLFTTAVLLLALLFHSPSQAARDKLHDASWQRTYDAYRQIPCLTPDELAYGGEVILGLNYNSRRIFRQICNARGIDFARSKEVWSILLNLDLSYEQVLCFEKWSALPAVTIDLALTALTEVKTLGYEAGRSFSLYSSLPRVTPDHALKTIPLLNRMNDIQNKALQGLLAIQDITAEQGLEGLGRISRMNDYQARATGAFARIKGMNMGKLKDATDLILLLNSDSAWNAGTLFRDPSMSAEEGWFWLVAYFANPMPTQEQQFATLSDQRKETLVRAMYAEGSELIWKINNLHAVTDWYGIEISNAELQGYSAKQLQGRFELLSPQIRSRFGARFYSPSGGRSTQISVLKEATAADRVETSRQLTSANIYALLAQGSELYDSSFRNILVPILQERVGQRFNNNLLVFLKATDPGNQYVSNFIVSLAQKGKMTVFFPDDPREQEQILDLVSQSAFKDEDSVILFSATFMHLLEVLSPSARTFLLTRMIQQADTGTATYARLIRVILQYYLEEFPELLGSGDKALISGLISRYGTVNLGLYQVTPFVEWKSDGALESISVFHPDDDGRDSFLSNGRTLLASGYRLELSDQFTLDSVSEQQRRQALSLIRAGGLPALFASMKSIPFAVAFVRSVNGVTISHAAFVYSGEQNQEQLMARFILGGSEMFAQRGHSYWRSEQITDPLDKLMKSGRLKEANLQAKQRFLSLGSCGGVKAYTHLNQMFRGHVDILATIGTGLATINDPYNKNFFEVIAKQPSSISWKQLAGELAFIFQSGQGRDYLQPGCLPAIMHKILDEEKAARNKQHQHPAQQPG